MLHFEFISCVYNQVWLFFVDDSDLTPAEKAFFCVCVIFHIQKRQMSVRLFNVIIQ